MAGNAAYVLGALIDSEDGRERVLEKILRVPAHFEETQNCIPNLGQLIEIHDLESMTNASGTASLLVSVPSPCFPAPGVQKGRNDPGPRDGRPRPRTLVDSGKYLNCLRVTQIAPQMPTLHPIGHSGSTQIIFFF